MRIIAWVGVGLIVLGALSLIPVGGSSNQVVTTTLTTTPNCSPPPGGSCTGTTVTLTSTSFSTSIQSGTTTTVYQTVSGQTFTQTQYVGSGVGPYTVTVVNGTYGTLTGTPLAGYSVSLVGNTGCAANLYSGYTQTCGTLAPLSFTGTTDQTGSFTFTITSDTLGTLNLGQYGSVLEYPSYSATLTAPGKATATFNFSPIVQTSPITVNVAKAPTSGGACLASVRACNLSSVLPFGNTPAGPALPVIMVFAGATFLYVGTRRKGESES